MDLPVRFILPDAARFIDRPSLDQPYYCRCSPADAKALIDMGLAELIELKPEHREPPKARRS